MMGLARLSMRRLSDASFWKLCGSGTGEGFTPKPNTAVYAILCVWPDLQTAQANIARASIFHRYRKRSSESWTVYLGPSSARGAWSGETPFSADHTGQDGPIAALTRATIKPRVALQFWDRVPDISNVIGKNNDVLFKIGIGEVPFLHQITFSIWPSTQSMAEFARHDGPHAKAISAVRKGLWFKEELYARFAVLDSQGCWMGQYPLKMKDTQ